MSMRIMGTRAALACIAVLASMASMTAPSWAAKGGNSANAKLCEKGGYPGDLVNQQGEAFKNEGACTSYAAKGGQLAGVDAVVTTPASSGVFEASYSGFGLKPGTAAFGGVRYQPSGISVGHFEVVMTDGTFSFEGAEFCQAGPEKVGSLSMEATTASGTTFVRDFSAAADGC